jgi:hypothetical protein
MSFLDLLKELIGEHPMVVAATVLIAALGGVARWTFRRCSLPDIDYHRIPLDESGQETEFLVRSHEPRTLSPGLALQLRNEQLESVFVLAGPWLASTQISEEGRKVIVVLNGFPPDGMIGLRVRSRSAFTAVDLTIDDSSTLKPWRFEPAARSSLLPRLENALPRWLFGLLTAFILFAGIAGVLPTQLESPVPARMWRWDLLLVVLLVLGSGVTYLLAKPPFYRERLLGGLDWTAARRIYPREGAAELPF